MCWLRLGLDRHALGVLKIVNLLRLARKMINSKCIKFGINTRTINKEDSL
jgi:hypothetical protein